MAVVSHFELLRLPIVSLETAEILGQVDEIVLDGANVRAAGFVTGMGVYEAKVLPFAAARAVGRDAVMVDGAGTLRAVAEEPELDRLIRADLSLSGATVLTETGQAVGVVGAFYLDRESGALAGFQLVPPIEIDTVPDGLVPVRAVRRIGEALVLVDAGYEGDLRGDEDELATAFEETAAARPKAATRPKRESKRRAKAPESPADVPPTPADVVTAVADVGTATTQGETATVAKVASPAAEVESPLEVAPAAGGPVEEAPDEEAPVAGEASPDAGGAMARLTQAQPQAEVEAPVAEDGPAPKRHFLIGKRVVRRIEASSGELIAGEGDTVTEEMIRRARAHDLLLVLSLNVD